MTTSRPDQPGAGAATRRQRRHDPPARHPPGRPRDADRRLPPPRRRRTRPTCSSRSRAASASAAIRSSASARAGCSRSATATPGSRPDRSRCRPTPDLPIETIAAPDPLAAIRAFVPRRRVQPTEGMPRFTGGAVGALAYDAISAFEPTVPLPERDPVGVPTAAFIETDLVLVFDHLTHTLSAIASLHTDAPDLEGRYRIAEAAIFEALERTARPSAAELAGSQPAGLGRDAQRSRDGRPRGDALARRPGRDEPRPRRVHPRRRGRQGRDRRRRGDPGRARAPPVVRPADRPRDRRARSTGSACTARSGGSTRARTCSSCGRPAFEVVGASPELLLQVEGDKLTTHPIAGTRPRGADAREDALLAEQLQRDPKERAEHVMLVDLGRNDLGRVARAGTVTVSKYMEVERYSHVLHLVSHVEGRLKPGARRARRAAVRLPGRARSPARRRSARCS